MTLLVFSLAACTQAAREPVMARGSASQYAQERAGMVGFKPLAINASDFSGGPDLAAIKQVSPATESGKLLRNHAIGYPVIAEAVQRYGLPGAVETRAASVGGVGRVGWQFAMYFRNPPRTLLYGCRTRFWIQTCELLVERNDLPRSVLRQVFGEGPMPPPWPVTIPVADAASFGSPKLPDPPKYADPKTYASAYVSVSEKARKAVVELWQGQDFERASKAFAKLTRTSGLQGLDLKLVVFESPDTIGFGLPDGSMFLSDSLIRQVTDQELVAVMAHVAGHEAYGHNRTSWVEAGLAKKSAMGAAVAATILLTMGLGPGPPQSLPFEPPTHEQHYLRQEELEANFAASRYLAELGIPPDVLFDALLKLSPSGKRKPETIREVPLGYERWREATQFGYMHQADISAADLGKMLDAGTIR